MPSASTMTSKGQITLPKEVRERLGIRQGDRLEFIEENGQTIMRRVSPLENPFLRWVGVAPLPDGLTSGEWQRELRGWDEWDRENLG